jgi:hypothetical protein
VAEVDIAIATLMRSTMRMPPRMETEASEQLATSKMGARPSEQPPKCSQERMEAEAIV